MIDQSKLNHAVENALRLFTSLMPTMTSGLTVKTRNEGMEFTIGNPNLPSRPVTIITERGEIVLKFAEGQYSIEDHDQRRTEE
jgi:hypothetical protein